MKNTLIYHLQLKKATEFFLEDLTFQLADFFVVVVNDLTSLDQEYIQKLHLKLMNHPDKVQQLYIVHNFKDAISTELLQKLWEEQVTNIYQTGEIITESIMAEDPVTKELVEKQVHWLNTAYSRHIYLANGNSEVGRDHNPWMFALLKQWLSSMFVPVRRNYSAMQMVLKNSNIVLPHYVENSGALEFDFKNKTITMQSNKNIIPRLKPATMDANGFIFLDEEFIPRVDSLTDEKGLTILLDVPGLTDRYKVTKVGWDIVRVTGTRGKPYPTTVRIDKCDRKYGAFKKEFKIPIGFEISAIKHSYENGVIRLFFPVSQLEEEIE